MWQLYALSGLLFQAGEEAVDKITIVGNLAIDTAAASFYRNFIFFLFAAVVGALGIIGKLVILVSWPILLVGLLATGSAVFYTYLLKHIELTGSSALGYSRPIIFLLIDVLIFKAAFAASQIVGVLLLIGGGLLFVINPRTRRLKREYTKAIWLIFVYETISYVAEYYVFKYYAVPHGLNEVSYIFNCYTIVVAGLLLIMAWKSSWWAMKVTALRDHYMGKITLSKGFDFVYAVLWYKALEDAAVSQVNALEAFYPLMLLVLLLALQRYKFKTGERFDRLNLLQKIAGTAVLIVGIWLVR